MSITIALSPDEILSGVVVAAQRKLTSDRRRAEGREGRAPSHYDEEPTWDQEIGAALAELAVCRWRNRYWLGSVFNGSVGSDAGVAQVRWTPYTNGHMIVYTEDKDEDPFVLVTGRTTLEIIGWCYGAEAKREELWRTDVKCPSWWVPQARLRTINATG